MGKGDCQAEMPDFRLASVADRIFVTGLSESFQSQLAAITEAAGEAIWRGVVAAPGEGIIQSQFQALKALRSSRVGPFRWVLSCNLPTCQRPQYRGSAKSSSAAETVRRHLD